MWNPVVGSVSTRHGIRLCNPLCFEMLIKDAILCNMLKSSDICCNVLIHLICFITIPVGEKSVDHVRSVLNNWFVVDITKG